MYLLAELILTVLFGPVCVDILLDALMQFPTE